MTLVSCVMPTADRRAFVPGAIKLFLAQTWPEKELVIHDNGVVSVCDLVPRDWRIRYFRKPGDTPLGEVRNWLCREAHGRFIAHWDDDDWYSPERIRLQMAMLGMKGVSGTSTPLFEEEGSGQLWRVKYPERSPPWLYCATLLYRKSYWRENPFPPLRVGEANGFVKEGEFVDLGVADFYRGRIHSGNTSPKVTSRPGWSRVPA